MRLLTLMCLLLAFMAGLASADYASVHAECGTTCANEFNGSGNCDFDMCRLCCDLEGAPEYFEEMCTANNGDFPVEGGGHCAETPNACEVTFCASLQLTLGAALLALQ